jgi:hypothetical protein
MAERPEVDGKLPGCPGIDDVFCDKPEGWEFGVVPRPRHAWGDVLCCPNEGCDLAFLVLKRPDT